MDTTLGNFTNGAAGGDESMTVAGITTDDIHVGKSGDLLAGDFHVFPGLANSDFDVVVEINAVNTGAGFFFASPFELGLNMDFNGVNTFIEGVAPPPVVFTDGRIEGSGNISVVPEPSPPLPAMESGREGW